MLVTTNKMLADAAKGGYAVGAFNAENDEMVWGIAMAAQELNAPVIIQTTSSTLKHLGPAYFVGAVKAAAKHANVPIALHLDHGSSYELAAECIECGYTSVMIDGSMLPFAENLELATKVSEYAKKFNIPVEAELGTIGGKEDATVSASSMYTNPKEAADYAQQSGISSLAISIGTAHGFYAVAPKLDLTRITDIKSLVNVPLVMHGASGIADETVREAAKLGMAKVNFATELRVAFSDAIRKYLAENPSEYDPKKYLGEARLAVKKLVMHKIKVCGSDAKA
ncbi:MAG: class II fructose-bisphosphate aldolase [Oscillospiraceae bacterium]